MKINSAQPVPTKFIAYDRFSETGEKSKHERERELRPAKKTQNDEKDFPRRQKEKTAMFYTNFVNFHLDS